MVTDAYWERVYAGVLGKVIGVYLGRPFENWSHQRIASELGEINSYVHEQLGMPLVVTDDDISGAFTFIRSFEDYGCTRDITAAQIGRSWLNYLIEDETILWWGGLGNSTEHTAFLRLKAGIEAPASGSIAMNGQVVAEQIGSQIFIDGWGLISPGDPQQASDFARRAASVSHDGEAIHGAQVIAAMIAQAFVSTDVDAVLNAGLAVIPEDSLIHSMIRRIRAWHDEETDWRVARDRLDDEFGYSRYGGNCHIVPNHGLIVLALVYGGGSFQKSMMIVNTAGWDTDCNSGNLGCILGVMVGLDGIGLGAGLPNGTDWRGPVADRLYLPTAEGGRAITDALAESLHVANMGRRLAGNEPLVPKGGARFHFELPGSVQGFTPAPETGPALTISNVAGASLSGQRSLSLCFTESPPGNVLRAETPTFIPSQEVARCFDRPGYRLIASPTIHPGQGVHARFIGDPANVGPVTVRVYVKHYNERDELAVLHSPETVVSPGESAALRWTIPPTDDQPIALIGVEIGPAEELGEHGHGGPQTVFLDELGWSGVPSTTLNRPRSRTESQQRNEAGPLMWRKAWVDALDARPKLAARDGWPEPYRLIQNNGRGMIMQGSREWDDYQVSATLTPHLCRAGGLAVRVQGVERYYALIVDLAGLKLISRFEGIDSILAEHVGGWTLGVSYRLTLEVVGNRLRGTLNDVVVLTAVDPHQRFTGGACGLVVEEGRLGCDDVAISPPRSVTRVEG